MDSMRFEQLVSEWLSEPQRLDLRRRIDDALRAAPALAPVLATLERLDAASRAAGARDRAQLAPLDWTEFRARALAALPAAPLRPTTDDSEIDRFFRLPTGIESSVNWNEFHTGVLAAVAAVCSTDSANADASLDSLVKQGALPDAGLATADLSAATLRAVSATTPTESSIEPDAIDALFRAARDEPPPVAWRKFGESTAAHTDLPRVLRLANHWPRARRTLYALGAVAAAAGLTLAILNRPIITSSATPMSVVRVESPWSSVRIEGPRVATVVVSAPSNIDSAPPDLGDEIALADESIILIDSPPMITERAATFDLYN